MDGQWEDKRFFRWVWWSSFLWALGLAMYQGVIGKYAIDAFQLSPLAYGWLDSLRELPGLGLVLLRIPAPCLWLLSLMVTAVGLWLHAWSVQVHGLLGVTLLYSTGVHVGSVVRDTVTLSLANPSMRARRLGQLASGAAAAGLFGLGLVALLSGIVPLHIQLVIAGCWSAVGAGLALPLLQSKRADGGVKKGFLFRWEYRSYYGLALLSALREMVTLTFVVFLLLRDLGWTEREWALLLAAHGLLAVLLRPWIGAWIDRVGQEKALVANYAAVTVLFLGYGWIRESWVLAVIFIIDQLLVALDDIALSTYVSKRVRREEWTATLAMGSTIAHGFAVLMPLAGGALWLVLGSTAPFLLGAIVTMVAGGYCAWLAATTGGNLKDEFGRKGFNHFPKR